MGTMLVAACTSRSDALTQHQEKFESLGASTVAIAEDWLGGATSSRYTGTALEQIYQLVEQERTALARTPQALAETRGAQQSEAAERLSRLLAVMIQDIKRGDQAAFHDHASKIPILPQRHP